MQRTKEWFGVLVVALPIAFVACGDGDDDGGSGGGKGGKGGNAGEAGEGAVGGTTTGGRGGSAGSTSGTSGASGRGGTGGASTGGEGGAGMGGFGGEEGGMGGEAGTTQGGTAGMSGSGGATAGMGGKGGAGAGGGGAGGGGAGAGGAGMGGAGAGGAGAGMGGAGAGGAGMGGAGMGGAGAGMGGAGAGGAGMGGAGMGGAGMGGAGMGGMGGMVPTCDPTPRPGVFVALLQGSQEVPPVTTPATGVAVVELNAAETQVTTSVYWSGLLSNTILGHIHGPAAVGVPANVAIDLQPPTGATSGSIVARVNNISATQVTWLKASETYVNIHSTGFGAGEIRGQLLPATSIRTGTLSGAQEVPPVASGGTGRAVAVVLPNNTQVAVSVTWSGLTSPTINAHIHGPADYGVPAGVLFPLSPPLGMPSGSVVQRIWDVPSGPADLLANRTYANVHSANFMSGELRAQLFPPCQ